MSDSADVADFDRFCPILTDIVRYCPILTDLESNSLFDSIQEFLSLFVPIRKFSPFLILCGKISPPPSPRGLLRTPNLMGRRSHARSAIWRPTEIWCEKEIRFPRTRRSRRAIERRHQHKLAGVPVHARMDVRAWENLYSFILCLLGCGGLSVRMCLHTAVACAAYVWLNMCALVCVG